MPVTLGSVILILVAATISMLAEAPRHGLVLKDKELACAPIDAATGQAYLGAMRQWGGQVSNSLESFGWASLS